MLGLSMRQLAIRLQIRPRATRAGGCNTADVALGSGFREPCHRLRKTRPREYCAMKTRAAVCHKAGQPLVIETVDLDGPRAGEVLVEIKATGICHTDEFTRSGADPEGLFPVIF